MSIDPNDAPKFNIGGYVRKIGDDMGTGQIVGLFDGQILDNNDVVHYQRGYEILWLDAKDHPVTVEAETAITPSVRAVPKFSTPEEADAYMESQVNAGGWVGKAQDAVDTSADWDIGLKQLLSGEDEQT